MRLIALLLVILVACVPVHEPEKEVIVKEPIIIDGPPINEKEEIAFELPTRTVAQIEGQKRFTYGFTEDNKLAEVKNDNLWVFKYKDDTLMQIVGPQEAWFEYENKKLTRIVCKKGCSDVEFVYQNGRISQINGEETLNLDYDGSGLLKDIRRGVSGRTSFEYDSNGRIQDMSRGQVTTTLLYDDKGSIRNLDADESKLILGYWRDKKLSSISGKTYGKGLSVSYGPDYPPTEATIIGDSTMKFSAPDSSALYNAVDRYLYCTQIRRLPVMFDGKAFIFFTTYFGGDIIDYIRMEVECMPYET